MRHGKIAPTVPALALAMAVLFLTPASTAMAQNRACIVQNGVATGDCGRDNRAVRAGSRAERKAREKKARARLHRGEVEMRARRAAAMRRLGQ
jgi:hypothetical protein